MMRQPMLRVNEIVPAAVSIWRCRVSEGRIWPCASVRGDAQLHKTFAQMIVASAAGVAFRFMQRTRRIAKHTKLRDARRPFAPVVGLADDSFVLA